jgi:hypothetical protein
MQGRRDGAVSSYCLLLIIELFSRFCCSDMSSFLKISYASCVESITVLFFFKLALSGDRLLGLNYFTLFGFIVADLSAGLLLSNFLSGLLSFKMLALETIEP